jgi:hypothetical protein
MLKENLSKYSLQALLKANKQEIPSGEKAVSEGGRREEKGREKQKHIYPLAHSLFYGLGWCTSLHNSKINVHDIGMHTCTLAWFPSSGVCAQCTAHF